MAKLIRASLINGSSDNGDASPARVVVPAPGPGLMIIAKQISIRIHTNNGRRNLPKTTAWFRRYAADDTEYTTPVTNTAIYAAGPRLKSVSFDRMYSEYRDLNSANVLGNTSVILELPDKNRNSDRQQILFFYNVVSSERLDL